MTQEERNKKRYRDFIEAIVKNRDPGKAWETVLPGYRAVDPSLPRDPGPEGVQRVFEALHAAIPDLRCDVEEVIAEGDLIAARWTLSGSVQGTLYGVPGRGQRVEIGGMSFNRFHDGGMAQGWIQWDLHGLLRQLGAAAELPPIDAPPR